MSAAMDGVRIASLLVLALAAAAAHAAEPRLAAGRMRTMLAAARPLAEPAPRAIFDMHFAESCIAVEGLPFERTCSHVPLENRDDPSPWPDTFIALQGARIVAAIVPRPDWVPRAWSCTRLPDFRGPRLCTAPGIDRATRRARALGWSTILRSAG